MYQDKRKEQADKMNYFDCHVDTLTEILKPGDTLDENSCNLDLKRVGNFVENYTQIFAIWKDAVKLDKEEPDRDFFRLYDRAMAYLAEENRKIALCLTGEEMEKAHKQRKAAAFLSIEDLSIMGKYVEKIREMGFRFAMLTWNYENEYACGAAADQAKGLTARGKEMVKVLTDQGIVMDISHLSDQGVEDLFQLTDRPVMASHSDIREVWDAPRNLQKVHLKELISRKGIIGMNFFAPFVGEKPQISDLLKHMDAVLEMGGEDCLAIGSDFDGCDGLFPAHIEGVQSMPFLREELLKHGFTEELTEKIFYKNAHRFVMENVK